MSFEDYVILTSIIVRPFLLCVAAIFFPFACSSCLLSYLVELCGTEDLTAHIHFRALQHACLQLTYSHAVMGVTSHGTEGVFIGAQSGGFSNFFLLLPVKGHNG